MSSTESQYLLSIQNQDKYRGKWIAILDNKILAEGTELKVVYKEAMEKAKDRTPLFKRIPEINETETLLL
ncbi:MAG: hypothetical protein HY295_02300 [Thaumarchaeota archaeon]|nr:hypothetical protein [Nitrososphaerota archaeon]